ncbi:hypothetical protein IEQ34_017913 [Dendrobium chrysotoxum]|uniref:Uncharacterized protein n=1 Tax=Dendrobium chrysotoxum TaxID=161865 RepID=A0AAV7GD39_DENCH|nr:hypothetical protein IEQ34_017913 [Dendrobium chrysotoxum]
MVDLKTKQKKKKLHRQTSPCTALRFFTGRLPNAFLVPIDSTASTSPATSLSYAKITERRSTPAFLL